MFRKPVEISIVMVALLIVSIPVAQAQNKAAARAAFCNKKTNATERTICNDRDLTRHDAILNDVYAAIRDKLSKREFRGVRDDQRAWLRERNRCGADSDCLVTKYTDRIAELEQSLEGFEHPNKSHVEIGCDGPDQEYVDGECREKAANVQGQADGSDMVWHLESFNDPQNKGRYTSYLRYSIPETDDVAFEAICQAGSSGTFATTTIGYNTGRLREGTNVKLRVKIGAHSQQLDGEVYGTQLEEGVSGVLVHPDYDDPFWEALASGQVFEYSVKGHDAARLSLKDSGGSIREFIATCKRITTASKPTVPIAKKSSPGTVDCSSLGSITSKNSKTPVTMTFTNRSEGHRGVLWINFEGTPVDYAALNPGESYTVKTYLTHPWMFTDGPGNCIEMFVPSRGVSQFDITAPNPHFGDEND